MIYKKYHEREFEIAQNVTVPEQLELHIESVRNVRDVGSVMEYLVHNHAELQGGLQGENCPSALCFTDSVEHSPAVAPRKIYRGTHLSNLTEAGQKTLLQMGVTDVIDLRTQEEVNNVKSPDILPPGINYHFIPIDAMLEDRAEDILLAVNHEELPTISDGHSLDLDKRLTFRDQDINVSEFVQYSYRSMCELYATFATAESVRSAFGKALRIIADSETVYIHCHSGKDRTGWLVALCNFIVGTHYRLILTDYLFSAASAEAGCKILAEHFSIEDWRIFTPFASVYADYLAEGLKAMFSVTKTTTIAAALPKYLELCGLNATEIANLRQTLLRKNNEQESVKK
jgi:protein tyrosine/serine phosphatase